MGVTSYYSFGGEILGEETGGVRRDYLTDALGSVTATVTDAGVVENTYRYKPYGETLAKTGTGSDPKFLWNGKWGYRNFTNNADSYVRHRHYFNNKSVWSSVDSFWPDIKPYQYAFSNPTIYIDSSGKYPHFDPWSCSGALNSGDSSNANNCISKMCISINDPKIQMRIQACIDKYRPNPRYDKPGGIGCLQNFCKSGSNFVCTDTPWKISSVQVCDFDTQDTKCYCDGSKKTTTRLRMPTASAQTVCSSSNDHQSPIAFCSAWWDSPCGKYGGIDSPPSDLTVTLLHEISHACVNCYVNGDHKELFDNLGKCIKSAVGCK
jgi:RHS repeat-associated protein